MKLRLFLANHAEVHDGLLFANGIGWTDTGPPSAFALCALIEVPWDETSRHRVLELDIVDVDGQPLQVPTPTGDQRFVLRLDFDVGRPPGAQPGRSFMVPVAINLQPLPFQPGRGYVVRALLDGQIADETAIQVRSGAAALPPPPA